MSENGPGTDTRGRDAASRPRRARRWLAGVAVMAAAAGLTGAGAHAGLGGRARPDRLLRRRRPTAASSGSAEPSCTGPRRHRHDPAARPIVGIAETSTGKGYWLVGADGGVFTYGDAGYFGSVPASRPRSSPPRSSAWRPPPTGKGYWLVGADGGVFAFGDAGYYGSLRSLHVTPPLPSWASPPRPPARATGSSAPTAACSPSATPATSATSPAPGRRARAHRRHRRHPRRRGLLGGPERRRRVALR